MMPSRGQPAWAGDADQLEDQPGGVLHLGAVAAEEIDRAVMLDFLAAGAGAPHAGVFERVHGEFLGQGQHQAHRAGVVIRAGGERRAVGLHADGGQEQGAQRGRDGRPPRPSSSR